MLKFPAKRKNVVIFLGFPSLLLMLIIGSLAPKNIRAITNDKTTASHIENKMIESKGESTEKKIDTQIRKEKKIPGILPVDVYGNFENKGFKLEKEIQTENSYFICTKEEKGIKYVITTYCEKGVNNVTAVEMTATRMSPQFNSVEDMIPFLKYGSSIPYEGADTEKVNAFINGNYFKNNSSIVISGVRFTIFCKTEFVRMIVIEPI